eukprot:g3036.t1
MKRLLTHDRGRQLLIPYPSRFSLRALRNSYGRKGSFLQPLTYAHGSLSTSSITTSFQRPFGSHAGRSRKPQHRRRKNRKASQKTSSKSSKSLFDIDKETLLELKANGEWLKARRSIEHFADNQAHHSTVSTIKDEEDLIMILTVCGEMGLWQECKKIIDKQELNKSSNTNFILAQHCLAQACFAANHSLALGSPGLRDQCDSILHEIPTRLTEHLLNNQTQSQQHDDNKAVSLNTEDMKMFVNICALDITRSRINQKWSDLLMTFRQLANTREILKRRSDNLHSYHKMLALEETEPNNSLTHQTDSSAEESDIANGSTKIVDATTRQSLSPLGERSILGESHKSQNASSSPLISPDMSPETFASIPLYIINGVMEAYNAINCPEEALLIYECLKFQAAAGMLENDNEIQIDEDRKWANDYTYLGAIHAYAKLNNQDDVGGISSDGYSNDIQQIINERAEEEGLLGGGWPLSSLSSSSSSTNSSSLELESFGDVPFFLSVEKALDNSWQDIVGRIGFVAEEEKSKEEKEKTQVSDRFLATYSNAIYSSCGKDNHYSQGPTEREQTHGLYVLGIELLEEMRRSCNNPDIFPLPSSLERLIYACQSAGRFDILTTQLDSARSYVRALEQYNKANAVGTMIGDTKSNKYFSIDEHSSIDKHSSKDKHSSIDKHFTSDLLLSQITKLENDLEIYVAYARASPLTRAIYLLDSIPSTTKLNSLLPASSHDYRLAVCLAGAREIDRQERQMSDLIHHKYDDDDDNDSIIENNSHLSKNEFELSTHLYTKSLHLKVDTLINAFTSDPRTYSLTNPSPSHPGVLTAVGALYTAGIAQLASLNLDSNDLQNGFETWQMRHQSIANSSYDNEPYRKGFSTTTENNHYNDSNEVTATTNKRMKTNAVLRTAQMSGLSVDEAIKTFRYLQNAGRLDAHVFSALLKVLRKHPDHELCTPEFASILVKDMQEAGVGINAFHLTALMKLCEIQNAPDEVLYYFKMLQSVKSNHIHRKIIEKAGVTF